ncbi:MAG TPA: anthranilate synthase component I family protein [Phycisphaerae bacterium]|nr:anthranilate synthase component I family protein [Phycisphaerae bacterium]
MLRRGYQEVIRWASRTIAPPGNVRALREAMATRPGGILLESVAAHAKWGRHTIFATDPIRVLSIASDGAVDPLAMLTRECRPWAALEPAPNLPFVGGWVGYLAYEAGRFIEPSGWLTRSDDASSCRDGGFSRLPISRWALFDTVVIHDELEGSWTVAGVELPSRLARCERPSLSDRLTMLERFVGKAGSEAASGEQRSGGQGRPAAGTWNFSREEYLRKVVRALEYIRAGDIFQVNLARRCRVPVASHAFGIYESLREMNPSTHAVYLPVSQGPEDAPWAAIVSSSPEVFLYVQGGAVTTRPIKGTRPRGATPAEDQAAGRELAESPKDRAELNMIIDLERNDLGRVCEFGTVRVVSDGEIETLPTVFHRTATVVGRLRPEADAMDLLRATFPGGSITGAPKVRAMQIINELEPTPRGPYCGAIGWVGVDGDMMLNLAIRTMVVGEGHADVMVGSGIVADSDPEAEYEELGAKAAGMLAALGVPKEEPPVLHEGRRRRAMAIGAARGHRVRLGRNQ